MKRLDIAAQLYIKKLDVKYINDENRAHVESIARSCLEAADIFADIAAVFTTVRPEAKTEQQLELPFPGSEL